MIFTSELVPTKEEGEFLLILPIQYAHSTYLISLITGLVRSLVLKRLVNVDDNVDFLTFLREISKIPSIEQQIISKIYKVYSRYEKAVTTHNMPIYEFLTVQDFSMFSKNPALIHSEGIMTY